MTRRRPRTPASRPAGAAYPSWSTLAPLGSLLLPLLAHGDASVPPPKVKTTIEPKKPKVLLVLPEIVVDGEPRPGRVEPPPPVMLGGVPVAMPVDPPKVGEPKKPEAKDRPPGARGASDPAGPPSKDPQKPCPKPPVKAREKETAPKGAKPPILTQLHPHGVDEPCFVGARVFRLRLT